jgi:hypothetical protein
MPKSDAAQRPQQRRAAAFAVSLALGLSSAASGCYRYAYHERSLAGPRGLVAIDRQQVEQHTAWSYFWGLQQADWAPDPLTCDGQGAGRVEVGFRWFTFPLLLLTLGIVAPNEVTVFCNTDAPPDAGP